MNFHKWSGTESGFAHEHLQIKRLTKILYKWSIEKNENVHLLTNFFINGEEIDAAIILKNNVAVIDLKSGSGNIIGGENGDWVCSQSEEQEFVINEKRKNPYLQAKDKRYAMLGYLENRKSEIFPSQKSEQMSFNHINSFIVFDGEIQWDKEQLPSNVLGWFDILTINSITDRLELIKSKPIKVRANNAEGFILKSLSLSQEESWLIPTLLNLNNNDNDLEEILEDREELSSIVDPTDEVYIEDEDDQEVSVDDGGGQVTEEPDNENLLAESHKDSNEGILSGVFIRIDGKRIIIKTGDNSRYTLHLNDQNKDVLTDLKKLSNERIKIINKEEININLVNVEISGTEVYLKDEINSYFIIEPAWLINVTTLTEFDFCPRSLFNKRFSLSQQNEHMIRGSIIHEVFEKILSDPTDKEGLQKELSKSFNGRGLDFELLGIDHKEMKKDFVRHHLNALYKYRKDPNESISNITDVHTERFIINPILGLKGKIDAVVKEENGQKAVELKTGKSWGGNAKPGHKFQVQAYSLLMEMKSDDNVLNPSVVYSGDYENQYYSGINREVSFNYQDKAHIINLRNKLVLADYLFTLDYEKENENKCNKCFQKGICKNIYNLESQHDHENIPFFHEEPISTEYSNKDIKFFNKYNRLLTEEYRVIKENQGNYLAKSVEDRLQLGKCIKVKNFQVLEGNEFVLSCANSSELREMDRCLLSDSLGPVKGECIESVIIKVSAKSIRIKTRAKLEFKPEYLDTYSSETAYERNYSAIYELINNHHLQKLKNILILDELPDENEQISIDKMDTLHANQKQSVELAIGLKDYLLIQGPPGTGKTLTIAHIVKELHNNNKKVILSCYTHRAIDEVTSKISKYAPGIPIYRLGAQPENVNDPNCILLESEINKEDGVANRVNAANQILSSYPIYIGTTHAWLSGRYDNLFKDEKYDVAIIDEASQVIIPNALGVIRLAKKFILVGDHNQLPPVIQSDEAKELTKTLFEILYSNPNTPDTVKVMLNIQHRMPKAISEFISQEFYNGELDVSDEASTRTLDVEMDGSSYKEIFDSNISIALINVESTKSHHSLNKVSRPEAKITVNILGDLLKQGILPKKVGIIAPFRAQVAEIRRNIELNLFNYFNKSEDIKPMVDTVDRFQGDERDVIIFSLTLIDENIPELLKDKRRLNVAISRARKKFIGVGNWNKVGDSETLKHLKEYVEKSDQSVLINNSEIRNVKDGVF